jgi:hypothetical protein
MALGYFMKEHLNRRNYEKESSERSRSDRQSSMVESASSDTREQELGAPISDKQKPLEENLL